MENKGYCDSISADDYIDLDAAADICDNEDSDENSVKEMWREAKVLDDDTVTTSTISNQLERSN
ncbi:hypothetical protein HK096_009167 [Nowakowskiella sp. JEL0078]|nr:hypothetical protein HK096_009167 [Nowakowskiella sp. JEL0078]